MAETRHHVKRRLGFSQKDPVAEAKKAKKAELRVARVDLSIGEEEVMD